MVGFLSVLLSMVWSVLSFLVEADRAGILLALAIVSALLAGVWKARPVLLLAAFLTVCTTFTLLPQGIGYWLEKAGLSFDLTNFSHVAASSALILTITTVAFILSCRKQSGGVRFSAQEASEDLERLVSSFSRLSALMFLPLLIFPVYFAVANPKSEQTMSLHLVSWQDGPMQSTSPQVQLYVWFGAILLLGGMAAAYVRNAHHRYPLYRVRNSQRGRAWIELLGNILLLLPLCALLIRAGLAHALEIQKQSLASASLEAVLPGLYLPQWGLYMLLPLAFLLLGAASLSVILRSLVFLYGPHYLIKRAATHVAVDEDPQFLNQTSRTQDAEGWY